MQAGHRLVELQTLTFKIQISKFSKSNNDLI